MKVGIIGAGESGLGAALLAKEKGYEVFVSDYGTIENETKEILKKYNIPFEEGGHDVERLIQIGFIIKSPGVPETAALVKQLRERDVRIISEVEFGYKFYNGNVIAITGSNGKTTTSGLFFHLLKTAGLKAELSGNIGDSFCRKIIETDSDFMVLELSSFQLDDIDEFKANIAMIINITPDHLDRYEYNFAKYAQSKLRITENQSWEDLLIINGDDQVILEHLKSNPTNARVLKVGLEDFKHGIFSKDGNSKYDLTLKGTHNLLNASLAVKASRALGLNEQDIQKGLSSFKNVPHRLEHIARINGVDFINDSKATNVDSAYYGLTSIQDNIIWIVGGADKGNDYQQILPEVQSRVKQVICLGVDNQKLIDTFSSVVSKIDEVKSTDDAVRMAFAFAERGDTVLLSPACASFDLFKNYEDRGDQFRRSVLELVNRKK